MGRSFFLKSRRQLELDLTCRAPRVSPERSRELAVSLVRAHDGDLAMAGRTIGATATAIREWLAGRRRMNAANAKAIGRLMGANP
jgi:hypothetical protein